MEHGQQETSDDDGSTHRLTAEVRQPHLKSLQKAPQAKPDAPGAGRQRLGDECYGPQTTLLSICQTRRIVCSRSVGWFPHLETCN